MKVALERFRTAYLQSSRLGLSGLGAYKVGFFRKTIGTTFRIYLNQALVKTSSPLSSISAEVIKDLWVEE